MAVVKVLDSSRRRPICQNEMTDVFKDFFDNKIISTNIFAVKQLLFLLLLLRLLLSASTSSPFFFLRDRNWMHFVHKPKCTVIKT